MIGCLCGGGERKDDASTEPANGGKAAPATCCLLTAVDGASPADPADGLAWSVGVGGGGGDQVVVRVAVQTRLLGRGLLLHLSGEPGGGKRQYTEKL